MHEEDAQYQRIFWHDDKVLINEYFLTMETFGTSSAPFPAIRSRLTSVNAIRWRSRCLEEKIMSMMFNQDSIKTLCSCWHPNKNGFGLNIKFPFNSAITKPPLLSTVARLFDPLGYLAPVIVILKILLKEVWSFPPDRKGKSQESLDWDDHKSDQLAERWQQIIQDLPDIKQIHMVVG